MADFWSGAGAGLLGGLVSGGLGLLGGFLGGDEEEQGLETYMPEVQFLTQPAPSYYAAPKPEPYAEFPEAEAARKTWYSRLMDWGRDPYYGAIQPDWENIWEQARKKVSQYYWGAPGQPGLEAKVRGSAARRGVSQSPALETELTRMGMGEAGMLKDIATQQAISKAQFGEQGRLNWLQSLTGLTGVRPSYYQPQGLWQQPYANVEQAYTGGGVTQPGLGPIIGELGSTLGTSVAQYSQMAWLQDLLKSMGGMPYGGGAQYTGMSLPGSNIPITTHSAYMYQ